MSKKYTLYYLNTDRGVAIRAAQNIKQARREAVREVGEDGLKGIRKATEADIAWVKGMGGYVPTV
jgi:hypothetical protein